MKKRAGSKTNNKAHPTVSGLLRLLQTRLDNWQLNKRWIGFLYAVLKKYDQDQGGNQAALVTYFGFLSLFPLLVVAMSVTQLSLFHSAHLKSKIVGSLNNYFPLIGQQLQNHVHAQQKAGIALVISILITVYGARGVASALQQSINHVWQVPVADRASGLKGIVRSLAILLLGGAGFMITGILSSYSTGPGHNSGFRLVTMLISLLLTFVFLMLIYKLCISRPLNYTSFLAGSAVAAIGLQLIQVLGGFIITHELRHFHSLYGSLALVFVALFWIYLQVRVFLYASEIDTVKFFKLWPRSLGGSLTPADRRALRLYAQRAKYVPSPKEDIEVDFRRV